MESFFITFNGIAQFWLFLESIFPVIGAVMLALVLFMIFTPKKIDRKIMEIDFNIMSSFLKK